MERVERFSLLPTPSPACLAPHPHFFPCCSTQQTSYWSSAQLRSHGQGAHSHRAHSIMLPALFLTRACLPLTTISRIKARRLEVEKEMRCNFARRVRARPAVRLGARGLPGPRASVEQRSVMWYALTVLPPLLILVGLSIFVSHAQHPVPPSVSAIVQGGLGLVERSIALHAQTAPIGAAAPSSHAGSVHAATNEKHVDRQDWVGKEAARAKSEHAAEAKDQGTLSNDAGNVMPSHQGVATGQEGTKAKGVDLPAKLPPKKLPPKLPPIRLSPSGKGGADGSASRLISSRDATTHVQPSHNTPHQIVVGGGTSALRDLDHALDKAEAQVEELRLRKEMMLRKTQALMKTPSPSRLSGPSGPVAPEMEEKHAAPFKPSAGVATAAPTIGQATTPETNVGDSHTSNAHGRAQWAADDSPSGMGASKL